MNDNNSTPPPRPSYLAALAKQLPSSKPSSSSAPAIVTTTATKKEEEELKLARERAAAAAALNDDDDVMGARQNTRDDRSNTKIQRERHHQDGHDRKRMRRGWSNERPCQTQKTLGNSAAYGPGYADRHKQRAGHEEARLANKAIVKK